jgi:hypothetical protein
LRFSDFETIGDAWTREVPSKSYSGAPANGEGR